MEKQMKFCKENNLPFFAPHDGKCWNCEKEIEDNGEELITRCPHCCISFCE